MTYELFKETLLAELSNHFPPDTQITIHRFHRNNRVSLDGLTILEAGCNASPAIYLQEFFEKLSCGCPFSEILNEILNSYRRLRPESEIDVSFFDDFSRLQEKIVCKLIHYERNLDLLAEIPHIPYLDLAIVFYSLLSADDTGSATILIRNSHLKRWNVSPQHLYHLAMSNTPLLLQPCIRNLAEILYGQVPQDFFANTGFDIANPDDYPLYLLTNQHNLQGAACILYPNTLSDFSRQKNCDLYIIPSSIHEVLLLPASGTVTSSELNHMVAEVNSTQLSPEEILSDHVYYYNRLENKISF